jgi:hypothetical protein
MSTRHALPGGSLRQERFASSFEQGLLANLVAKRCITIDRTETRAAVWFAQWKSWQPGGLGELLREMRRSLGLPQIERDSEHECIKGLERMCLDPECSVEGVGEDGSLAPVFREDWQQLETYRAKWILDRPHHVQTSIGQRVTSALEYTQNARILTLIDGPARIGKTFAARVWCEASAGMARYIQVPCSSDETSFFRAIGRGLGVSSSVQLKAAEIRARVDEVLGSGDLAVVFDEAHYLWPQQWRPYASPSRVNWIMTALVNQGVPVALVTTPQFYVAQKRVEKLTGWTSEQFIGRIGHVERLNGRLEKADLLAVSRALLPEGDGATLKGLVAYAILSKKNLASIEAIVKRARWLAGQDGRNAVSAVDVRTAMQESIMPSDNALADSLGASFEGKRNTLASPRRPYRGLSAADAPGVLLAPERGITHSGRAVGYENT